jgi:hypothetical protein
VADKTPKAKRKKAPEASVLGSLPSTRPTRVGRPRTPAPEAAAQPARNPKPRAKPRPKAAARPRPAHPEARAAERPRPRAVSSGAPALDDAARTPPPSGSPAPGGVELVTTVIQATGELARIGITVGGQVLKRALDRIPHP